MKQKLFTFLCIILFAFISTASLLYAQDTNRTSHSPGLTGPKLSVFYSIDSSLIEPGTLAKTLSDSLAAKPVILHVGVPFQFKNAHIPGTKSTGMAMSPDGIKALEIEVENIPRDTSIIIYCGCCPWKDCPNIHPAYNKLQQMGFTKVKALYISKNFQNDWIDKNFPIEKSKE